jgi:hypothetical protein
MGEVREVVGRGRANAGEQRAAGREESSEHGGMAKLAQVTVKGQVFTSVW